MRSRSVPMAICAAHICTTHTSRYRLRFPAATLERMHRSVRLRDACVRERAPHRRPDDSHSATGEEHDVKAHHRVYVIRLRNPRRGDRREAFYVGMTGLPISERFANHKRGYKSAGVVTKYGVELAPEWY